MFKKLISFASFLLLSSLLTAQAAQECSTELQVHARYYQFSKFGGSPSVSVGVDPTDAPYLDRYEDSINNEFKNAGIGLPGKNNYVVVIYDGFITPPATGAYTFMVTSDDGARLTVNNQVILDNWSPQNVKTTSTSSVSMNKYSFYSFRLEYFNRYGGAVVKLMWHSPVSGFISGPVPASALYSTQCVSGSFDNCQSNPCLNGATCNDATGTFTCTCANGFSGLRCQDLTTPTCTNSNPPTGINNGPPGTASFVGDPHITTFDGTSYSLPTTGTFYALRSLDGSVAVQIQLLSCTPSSKSMCIGQVALTYKGAVAVAVAGVNMNTYGASGKLTYATEGAVHTFTTSDGMVVRISDHSSNRYDLRLTLPSSYAGLVRGLAGTLDGQAGNDYIDLYGNVVSFTEFATVWIVPSSEDLGLDHTNTIPSLVRDFTINCTPGSNTFPTPTPTSTSNPTCPTYILQSTSSDGKGNKVVCFKIKKPSIDVICATDNFIDDSCSNSCSSR